MQQGSGNHIQRPWACAPTQARTHAHTLAAASITHRASSTRATHHSRATSASRQGPACLQRWHATRVQHSVYLLGAHLAAGLVYAQVRPLLPAIPNWAQALAARMTRAPLRTCGGNGKGGSGTAKRCRQPPAPTHLQQPQRHKKKHTQPARVEGNATLRPLLGQGHSAGKDAPQLLSGTPSSLFPVWSVTHMQKARRPTWCASAAANARVLSYEVKAVLQQQHTQWAHAPRGRGPRCTNAFVAHQATWAPRPPQPATRANNIAT